MLHGTKQKKSNEETKNRKPKCSEKTVQSYSVESVLRLESMVGKMESMDRDANNLHVVQLMGLSDMNRYWSLPPLSLHLQSKITLNQGHTCYSCNSTVLENVSLI